MVVAVVRPADDATEGPWEQRYPTCRSSSASVVHFLLRLLPLCTQRVLALPRLGLAHRHERVACRLLCCSVPVRGCALLLYVHMMLLREFLLAQLGAVGMELSGAVVGKTARAHRIAERASVVEAERQGGQLHLARGVQRRHPLRRGRVDGIVAFSALARQIHHAVQQLRPPIAASCTRTFQAASGARAASSVWSRRTRRRTLARAWAPGLEKSANATVGSGFR